MNAMMNYLPMSITLTSVGGPQTSSAAEQTINAFQQLIVTSEHYHTHKFNMAGILVKR